MDTTLGQQSEDKQQVSTHENQPSVAKPEDQQSISKHEDQQTVSKFEGPRKLVRHVYKVARVLAPIIGLIVSILGLIHQLHH